MPLYYNSLASMKKVAT